MKKSVLLVLLCWLVVSVSYSQSWRRVGSWGNNFSDIKWVNNEIGYLSGENIFLKTIDGGLSWTEQLAPTPNRIVKMDFFDENNGIVLAQAGTIYRTTNGGQSWQVRTLPRQERLTGVKYLSQNKIGRAHV